MPSTALRTLLDESAPRLGQGLPRELAEPYGGDLTLPPRLVYANAVSSIDGVVALERRRGSGARLSGRDPADRFVMGLLRAHADVIVAGAGTFRADGGQPWTAAGISPAHAAAFERLGRAPARLAVVTAGGDVDPADPALLPHGLILAGSGTAPGLRSRAPAGVAVRALGDPPFTPDRLLAAVRAEGHDRVLIEGGPHLLAGLMAAAAVEELFLTLSPIVAGRPPGGARLGLAEGADLLPTPGARWRLVSLKARGSLLFLRYGLGRSTAK
jgi:riboflavin biosynthesis pyrimidine reductase